MCGSALRVRLGMMSPRDHAAPAGRWAEPQLPLLVCCVLRFVDAEVALNRFPALLDLVTVLVTELLLGDILGLIDPVVDLVRVLSRHLLDLVDEPPEVWHRVYPPYRL